MTPVLLLISLFAGSSASESFFRQATISSALNLDNNRTLVSSSLLGGPAAQSTSDCGSTSGTVPSIPAASLTSFYYTQLGCSGSLYSSMSVDFGFTQTTANNVVLLVITGSACKSQLTSDTIERAILAGGGYSASTVGSGSFSKSCGNVDTCCVAIVCGNSIFSCTGMSYTSNFIAVLNGGAVAGIVIGSLIGLLLIAFCIRTVCSRRSTGDSSTTTLITMAAPNPAYGQQYGQQYHQGPPVYQQGAPPSYQGPQPQYVAPQQYSTPPYMQQSAPQAWGEPSKPNW